MKRLLLAFAALVVLGTIAEAQTRTCNTYCSGSGATRHCTTTCN